VSKPYDDPALPLFSVGQVAEMLDVAQPFLRRIEAHGLVSPGRSDGQQRRYSRNDIDRVSEIVGLVDEGCTLAGVRRILELQEQLAAVRAELAAVRQESRAAPASRSSR
jgi:MerR family transcriptional regulator/heat shock protein HspR